MAARIQKGAGPREGEDLALIGSSATQSPLGTGGRVTVPRADGVLQRGSKGRRARSTQEPIERRQTPCVVSDVLLDQSKP